MDIQQNVYWQSTISVQHPFPFPSIDGVYALDIAAILVTGSQSINQ
jgi:hypothetical protein